MTGQNPLDFITLNDSDYDRSGGRVFSWINYWWKDRKEAAWGVHALKRFSHDDWFELHRMGVVRRQDEALTVDQIMLLGEIAEEDWSKSKSEEENKELESEIAFSTIELCVSLQGEEVPLIVI